MLLSKVLDRFIEKSPVSVMARAAMEHALAPEALDELFDEHADKQYTRELLFSSRVDLMGVVVSKVAPSVHAAYQAVAETLPVSLASIYNKLNNLEPAVTSALVRHTAERLAPVIDTMGGDRCRHFSPDTGCESWMAITWPRPNGVFRYCVRARPDRCPDTRSLSSTRR
ncbi:hypothetical protein [Sorangium sp. So ce128]|uniref:hypothetical protein n=1 Tax=Sorangium sp. So ce128 TaxID=3133281 RepID=UPI003F622256